MKIGIGCTTFNRPAHIELFQMQIGKHTDDCFKFHIARDTDKDRKGIAYRKNECLSYLKDCDYIFLFDDDTFPIKEGWAEFFIEAYKASGQHHFLYLKETPNIKSIETVIINEPLKENGWELKINSYNNCGGCFMFLTKEVIERVGGYCQDYGLYGYEHAGYSIRIHLAGLTPMGKYLCPGPSDYIYSMDYDFHRKAEFQDKVKHKPSMPVGEVIAQQIKNKTIFEKDIQTIFQPLQ